MPFNATVLYSTELDATFDLKYYSSHHPPLSTRKWSSHCLKDRKVVEFQAGLDGGKPYSIAAVLTWEGPNGIQASSSTGGAKAVFDEVPNSSNE